MIRPRDRATAAGLLPRMEARPRKDGLITYRYHPVGEKPVNLGTDKAEALQKVPDMHADPATTARVYERSRQVRRKSL